MLHLRTNRNEYDLRNPLQQEPTVLYNGSDVQDTFEKYIEDKRLHSF